jgi:glutathione S-transferase
MWSLLAHPQTKAMLPVDKFPAIAAYVERISARPAFARGFERTLR